MNFKTTLRAGVKMTLCMSGRAKNEDFHEEARRKPFSLIIHHYDRLDLLILVAVKAARDHVVTWKRKPYGVETKAKGGVMKSGCV